MLHFLQNPIISCAETQSASYEALFCVFSAILSTIRFFFTTFFQHISKRSFITF